MSMTANQDGSTLAWATDDGTIWVWTGNANPKPLAQNQDSLISSVVLSDDGELVLCVDDDGTALIWQSKTGELARSRCPTWSQRRLAIRTNYCLLPETETYKVVTSTSSSRTFSGVLRSRQRSVWSGWSGESKATMA